MNKKTLSVILVIVLFLLVGGWYAMTQKKAPEPAPTENTVVDQEPGSTNLKDLFTKGLAQTCTYSSDSGNGTVYVDNGMMRGDFESKYEGKTMMSHMIVKDNTSYIWSDDQETGISMAFDPNSVSTTVDNNTPVQSTSVDLNTNYDYDCDTWVSDSTVFDIPSDITFSTFEVPSADQSSGSAQCGYCDALSGDEKEQCLTALKCN